MQTVKQILKPDWRKLFLFAIFIAIAVGGKIQAWAFSEAPPQPPFYDLLQPFPLWPIWMYLLIPLALLVLPLRLFGIDVMGGPLWLFTTANIVYFYLLSCLMVACFDWVKAKWKSQREMTKPGENHARKF